MKKNKLNLIGGIAITLIVIMYIFNISDAGVKNLNPNKFDDLINSEETFVINTHTPYVGEIKNTDLIAEEWNNMENYIDDLPEDKNIPIAVYCRSGNMAKTSSEQLIEMGYNHVYNLEGGMNSWKSSGKDIVFDSYDGPVKEFDMIADEWEFTPSLIEVNLGDRVILHIESEDEYHGIALTDFGINRQLPPGQIIDIEFIADKQGSFSFFCSVPCGMGHSSMGGQLIVN